MKKLMFAAALATVGAAFAIESQNIVGYSQNNLVKGNIMLTPQFTAVNGGAIKVTDIVPVGGDTIYGIAAAKLNAYGRATEQFLYTSEGGENENETGWVNPSTNEMITDATVAPGEGLWIRSFSADDKFQTAGAVGKDDVKVELSKGNVASGNPFPVQVSVQDIYMTGDNAFGVAMATLDAYGHPTAQYLYTNEGGEDENETGWVDAATNDIVSDKINPGEGLWIRGADDVTINFPAPEL